jgi:hypothetical protein
VAAEPGVGRSIDEEELAVGGGERRPRGPFGQSERQGRQPRPLQQRLDEALGPRHRALSRIGADHGQPGAAQHVHGGGECVRGQDHVGVHEHQHTGMVTAVRRLARERGVGELLAGPGLAEPAGRHGRSGQQLHACVGAGHLPHHLGGAIGRLVVQHDDPAVGYRVEGGPDRGQAVADPVGLVARRHQHGDALTRRRRIGRGSPQPAQVVQGQAETAEGQRGACACQAAQQPRREPHR